MPALTVFLTPGVAKGAGAKSVEFASPAVDTPIRLKLALPGQAEPRDYTVRILAVDSLGHPDPVWSSRILRSVPAGSDGQVTAEPDSSILPPNDYIVEVAGLDHIVENSYVFRVTPRRGGR
jgi:hypothetical protein